MKLPKLIPATLTASLLGLAMSVSAATNYPTTMAAPWSSGMTPWSGGFSPWSMGGNPWSGGFSPWSMGASPWSGGFSPWSMGGNPWSGGGYPWGGNGWNSSIWPWAGNYGGNSWMPWSNGSSFFGGRRNNDDWVTSMFLMNSMNNQQAWNPAMFPPAYPYQAPMATQQSLPMLTYPQMQPSAPQSQSSNTSPGPAQNSATTPVPSFPAASSGFSPFAAPSSSTTSVTTPTSTQQPAMPAPAINPPSQGLVFPDGSRY
jgi:hypothetical protein